LVPVAARPEVFALGYGTLGHVAEVVDEAILLLLQSQEALFVGVLAAIGLPAVRRADGARSRGGAHEGVSIAALSAGVALSHFVIVVVFLHRAVFRAVKRPLAIAITECVALAGAVTVRTLGAIAFVGAASRQTHRRRSLAEAGDSGHADKKKDADVDMDDRASVSNSVLGSGKRAFFLTMLATDRTALLPDALPALANAAHAFS